MRRVRAWVSPLVVSLALVNAARAEDTAYGATEGATPTDDAAKPYGQQPESEPSGEVGAYQGPTRPEDELADAPAAAKKDARGMYVTMAGGLSITPESTHQWGADGCPNATLTAPSGGSLTWNPGCQTTVPIGLLADFRIGYSFGFPAIEFFALGAADWSSASVNETPSIPGIPDYASQMHVGRIGGALGGNVRLMTPPSIARFTAGIGAGAMFRHIYSNVSSLDGSAEGYAAPMLRADAGIILFGFLTAGVMGWLEFAPDVLVSPNFTAAGLDPTLAGELSNAVGDVTVFQGNQAFIGLFAGLYMGN